MTSRSAAEIAFGVMGVYLLASNIPSAVVSIPMAFQESSLDPNLHWLPFLGVALSLASGVGVIVFRRGLAAMLAPATEPAEDGNGTGGVQAAAIAVIGTFYFASGLQLFLAERLAKPTGWQSSSQTLPEMAVGAALFLGARGIVVIWQKLRTAGRAKD